MHADVYNLVLKLYMKWDYMDGDMEYDKHEKKWKGMERDHTGFHHDS